MTYRRSRRWHMEGPLGLQLFPDTMQSCNSCEYLQTLRTMTTPWIDGTILSLHVVCSTPSAPTSTPRDDVPETMKQDEGSSSRKCVFFDLLRNNHDVTVTVFRVTCSWSYPFGTRPHKLRRDQPLCIESVPYDTHTILLAQGGRSRQMKWYCWRVKPRVG